MTLRLILNPFDRLKTSGQSCIALLLMATMLCFTTVGCTAAQQAQAKADVAKIIAYEPEVQTAVDTLASVLDAFLPADAALINAAQSAFDGDLALLQAACNAYTATPNTGTLQAIGAALNQVLADNANQFLAAAHITNPTSQAEAKLAIGGVRTILLLMDGLFQHTQTPTQNAATATARNLKLREVLPYLDRERIEQAYGPMTPLAIHYEEAEGF